MPFAVDFLAVDGLGVHFGVGDSDARANGHLVAPFAHMLSISLDEVRLSFDFNSLVVETKWLCNF